MSRRSKRNSDHQLISNEETGSLNCWFNPPSSPPPANPLLSILFVPSSSDPHRAALTQAIRKGYTDVVSNLLAAGINWDGLDHDSLCDLVHMVSDQTLKEQITAHALAKELDLTS